MAEKAVQESRAVPRGKVSPMKSLTSRKARGRLNEHGGKAKSTRGDLGKRVSVDGFRGDPMFPRIERVVADLLAKGNVVTPVDVLIGMGLLRPDRLNDWRCGRVPYLERVIDCNLTRLSRLLRILRFHAHDLNLKPSATCTCATARGPSNGCASARPAMQASRRPTPRISWPGKRPFHAARAEPVPRTNTLDRANAAKT
jgi:hypothetical protein